MDKAWRFGFTLATIFTIIELTVYIVGGGLNLYTICFTGIIFVMLTVFFWIVYIVSKAIGRTEKTIWSWMRENEK